LNQSGTRTELPTIRLRVTGAAAERVLREQIEAIPRGRLIANAADLSAWVADIRPWVARGDPKVQESVKRWSRPRFATDFAACSAA
jgi:hypothetical protein